MTLTGKLIERTENLPRDRKSLNVWFRHLYQTNIDVASFIDTYVYDSLNLFSAFEILNADKEMQKSVSDIFSKIKLFELLKGITLEYWLIGDVFILGVLDLQRVNWEYFVVLNPDQVEVRRYNLLNKFYYELIPDDFIKKLVLEKTPEYQYLELKQNAPEIIQAVTNGRNIPIDNAHITHLKHMPVPYGFYGQPLLKSFLTKLISEDKSVHRDLQNFLGDLCSKRIYAFKNLIEDFVNEKIINPMAETNEWKKVPVFHIPAKSSD